MAFTQPVSMKVTEQQYEELKPKLEALGYFEDAQKVYKKLSYLVSNLCYTNGRFGVTERRLRDHYKRHFIDHYNPELFLALAAMQSEDFPIVGEWMYSLKDANCDHTSPIGSLKQVTKGKYQGWLYFMGTGMPYTVDGGCWRKATKEELIKHFTKSESMTIGFYITTREAFGKVWDCACESWRPQIVELAKKYEGTVFNNEIHIPHSEVEKMFNAAGVHKGVDQKAVLSEAFPEYSAIPKTLQEMADKYCGGVVADGNNVLGNDKAMISLRSYNAFYLSSCFDWELKGYTLTPTPKS